MKERPILFSSPMVLAILADSKTQTRRVCKKAKDHEERAYAVCKAAKSGWIAWFGRPNPNVEEFTK